VLEAVLPGATHDGIARARDFPSAYQLRTAVAVLGNGNRVVSSVAIPLCLWIIIRHHKDVGEAMWTSVEAVGDRDTTCAIIGGIMALLQPACGLPVAWIELRAALRFDVDRDKSVHAIEIGVDEVRQLDWHTLPQDSTGHTAPPSEAPLVSERYGYPRLHHLVLLPLPVRCQSEPQRHVFLSDDGERRHLHQS
jgi:hypothetical protein